MVFIFIQQSAKLEAGLPNINGNFGCSVPDNHSQFRKGAVNPKNFTTSGRVAKPAEGQPYTTVFGYNINANSYNPIYGNSNTVQPPAIVLIPQVKY